MRRLIVLALVIAVAGCSGQPTSRPVLKYTAIPDQNTTELIAKFAPLSAHLGQVLGVPVEYVPARDYQASVEMFRNGDVHFAWFGGLTGVQARAAVPGAKAIAQGSDDPTYFSYFICNASAGLEPGETFPFAIKDLAFTFGSESSTSGRLMPEYFIKENTGQSPPEFFSQPIGFSGSHDKTCELVEAGRYQAGVVNFKVFDQRIAAGMTDSTKVEVIWQTPRYADYNFTAHPAIETVFGAGFTGRLQQALVAIDDPALLRALPRDRLIPASDEEYAGIEAVARDLGMLR
ncbi:MAG TPA: putative selenate ABC transporter substrate-binding protein [Candidatus Krumholzibacteria bacterium]|nr:putative selenate ABC transporter substrate-binding protein [Candidatus Krumholzibacteria bacterium]HPD72534.1 putative selenate ABC transporter substrate-binding protein [Candidatus Krumholzibacteria bacterium]HRY40534.1 putative selenate ABC transporter substrate-binding protein [Candidatus Krumholzibacteria bacterium]